MNETETPVDYVALTADIVAAYVSNNPVPAAELAGLIGNIHGAPWRRSGASTPSSKRR